jgi:hypothetical protein
MSLAGAKEYFQKSGADLCTVRRTNALLDKKKGNTKKKKSTFI